MAEFKFEETSISSQYGINLKDNYNMSWIDTRTADLCRVLFMAIADTLKFNQTKDAKRIGMTIKDDKGNFKMGAILNYKEPEEGSEEDSGNWYLEFTFNPEDMKDIQLELDNHSDIFIRCATQRLYDITFGRFKSTELMYIMFNTLIDTLVEFLDANYEEKQEEIELSLRGVFTATIGVENGKKIISIVPGEIVKQAIKNDAVL